jgi:hypothetical protein
VKDTSGGKVGHVPSAPEAWNRQNSDSREFFVTTTHKKGEERSATTTETTTEAKHISQGQPKANKGNQYGFPAIMASRANFPHR